MQALNHGIVSPLCGSRAAQLRALAHTQAAISCNRRPSLSRASSEFNVPDEPDFDELKLDENYYREMGIDSDELETQTTYRADDIDPEGYEAGEGLEGLFDTGPDAPTDVMDRFSSQILGPKAVLLAGLRLEEIAIAREILDAVGASEVKLVPCTSDMLHQPLAVALEAPEPEWHKPRPESASQGGGWGSQRVALFSGLSLKAVATAVELLEESGLPPLCTTFAIKDDAQTPLGELLAEAVKDQRGRKYHDKELWEEAERVKPNLPDVANLISEAASKRLQEIEQAAAGGRLEDILGSDSMEMSPKEAADFQREMAAAVAARAQEGVGVDAPQTASAGPPAGSSAAPPAQAADSLSDPQPAVGATAGRGSDAAAQQAGSPAAQPSAVGTSQPSVTAKAASASGEATAASASSISTKSAQPARSPEDDGAAHQQQQEEQQFKNAAVATAPAMSQPGSQHAAHRVLYQQPAGPAMPPPPRPTGTQQMGTQPASVAATLEQQQQQQSATAGDAMDVFYAKYTLETLAMQREQAAAEAAEAAVNQPGWDPELPSDWQTELAQIKATGETRADILRKKGVHVARAGVRVTAGENGDRASSSGEPQRRPYVDTSAFDVIDRIVEQPDGSGDAAAPEPDVQLPAIPGFSREAIEAALQNGADAAELKRIIDEAVAATAARHGPRGAPPRQQRTQPAAARPATQQPPRAPPGKQPLAPWQQPSQPQRRQRQPVSRRSPFMGQQAGPGRLRHREEAQQGGVRPMTMAELTAAAQKHGKDADAWLADAKKRGIEVAGDGK